MRFLNMKGGVFRYRSRALAYYSSYNVCALRSLAQKIVPAAYMPPTASVFPVKKASF